MKGDFDAAHAKSVEALEAHDYHALGKAIERESAIMNEHIALIRDHVADALQNYK